MWTGRYVFNLYVTSPSSGCHVKCEADLPESLRLGRVQVSCEGWTGPGDSYVLKGTRIQLCLASSSTFRYPVCRIMLSRVPPPGSTKCLSTGLLSPRIKRIVYMYAGLFSEGKRGDTKSRDSGSTHELWILCAAYRSPRPHHVQVPTPVLRGT